MTSAYEYLERRFHRVVRYVGSFTFIIQVSGRSLLLISDLERFTEGNAGTKRVSIIDTVIIAYIYFESSIVKNEDHDMIRLKSAEFFNQQSPTCIVYV